MLEPQTRAAFAEELKPPPGFTLSHAVGTTFTLDLVTALSVPLSFASHRLTASDDAVGILDAIRRCADRIDIFAQAGEIRIGKSNALVSLLETMVHPVALENPAALFHPKVWLLEFTRDDASEYRFLCASRNLTDDKSWDILLRLDGSPARRAARAGRRRNAPLAQLLRSLSGIAVIPLGDERKQRVDALAERVLDVEWQSIGESPPTFHFFDGTGTVDFGVHGTDALIISPFISDDGLARLRSNLTGQTHLLSRADQIDRLAPESLDDRLETHVIDEAALDIGDPNSEDEGLTQLTGLHAKALIFHGGHRAHVLVGSANATSGAYTRNVEMMVGFDSLPQREFGVFSTLDALKDLTERYASTGGAPVPEDELAEYRLELACRALARIPFSVRRFAADPHGVDVWAFPGATAALSEFSDLSIEWRMVTTHRVGGRITAGELDASRHTGLELVEITPFIEVTATDAQRRRRSTIILATMLDDLPERRDAIIASQLTDTQTFIRLLSLMLELSGLTADAGPALEADLGFLAGAGSNPDALTLLEPIVRAVGDPDGSRGLEDAHRIIELLRRQDRERPDQAVLPQGFDELWDNAWAAFQLWNPGPSEEESP